MNAEIVVTGSELLLGETIDTNSAMMARMLRDIGLNLFYKSTVGDNQERLAGVLSIALGRSDVILISGGLGPTVDDVTREAVATATNHPLVFHEELLEQIKTRFARFGRPMSENNRRQAYVPEGAIVVENPVGTAPAFIVEDPQGTIIALPGVPRELEYLMKTRIIPYLQQSMGETAIILAKTLRTCAVGESQIDLQIGDLMTGSNPTVGLLAHSGQVDIRITAKATNPVEAQKLIAPIEADLRNRLGHAIYGEDDQTLESIVSRLLAERNVSLALLDCVTGGQAAEWLGDSKLPQVLLASTEFPDLETAVDALPIESDRVIRQPQTVSEEVADYTRRQAGADLGLVMWGMVPPANSNAGDDQLPLAYVTLSHETGVISRSRGFGTQNSMARRWLAIAALDLLRRYLIDALDEQEF